jgi:hypothetical protein
MSWDEGRISMNDSVALIMPLSVGQEARLGWPSRCTLSPQRLRDSVDPAQDRVYIKEPRHLHPPDLLYPSGIRVSGA